jgi:hypothetical protein
MCYINITINTAYDSLGKMWPAEHFTQPSEDEIAWGEAGGW